VCAIIGEAIRKFTVSDHKKTQKPDKEKSELRFLLGYVVQNGV